MLRDASLRGWGSSPRGQHPSVQRLGAFKLVTDVSSSKEGLRSSGTDDLEPAGDLLKDGLLRKEAFNYEDGVTERAEFDDDYKALLVKMPFLLVPTACPL